MRKLVINEIYTNQEISEILNVKEWEKEDGGILISDDNKTVVLQNVTSNGDYNNGVLDDVYLFEGLNLDDYNNDKNHILENAKDATVYLFDVLNPNELEYKGKLKLIKKATYFKYIKDENN
jgi:hypothetical protein